MILRPVQAVGVAAITVFFGMLGASHSTHAHPHVWVTVETEILHDGQKNITGFRHTWTFDEFYSSFAIQGMDKNNDGQYDREELKELAEINVTSLREFGFFTFPQLAGHQIDRQQPHDYWLEHKNSMLTLHFTLPLKEPVPRAQLKDFLFTVSDPTFYVGFGFAEKDPIRIAAGLPDCKPEIAKPAQTVHIKCGGGS